MDRSGESRRPTDLSKGDIATGGRPSRGPGSSPPALHRGRCRAFRASEPEQDIARRMAGLSLGGYSGPALQRALRAARRAARAGALGYDPARHAALLRLLKQKTPP